MRRKGECHGVRAVLRGGGRGGQEAVSAPLGGGGRTRLAGHLARGRGEGRGGGGGRRATPLPPPPQPPVTSGPPPLRRYRAQSNGHAV